VVGSPLLFFGSFLESGDGGAMLGSLEQRVMAGNLQMQDILAKNGTFHFLPRQRCSVLSSNFCLPNFYLHRQYVDLEIKSTFQSLSEGNN
jgi:hypothetical protein